MKVGRGGSDREVDWGGEGTGEREAWDVFLRFGGIFMGWGWRGRDMVR